MNSIRIQIYLFFVIILVTSCRNGDSRHIPDVSHIVSDIKIARFDRELSRLNAASARSWNTDMKNRYGQFYADFIVYMLEAGDPWDTVHTPAILGEIATKKDFRDLAKAVGEKYPDLGEVEEELNQACRYLKYYIEDFEEPRFISFFSGFAYQVPVGEDYVGIGLDMFLGKDSEFYPALVGSIPLYLSRRFTKENIVPRVVEGLLREDILPQSDTDVNTLQHMIYHGKILYAMDLILPHAADSVKIGYTPEQLVWADRYKADVWAWFLDEGLLYSTDFMRTQKYFTEAPFTPELGENNESAPKLGSYMGWQIVRKYMERNREISLRELFVEQDAQKILEESKFKGK